MLVEEHSPAPRVVAGLRKLRPELTPEPVTTLIDPVPRISGVLRQYYTPSSWAWVSAAVRGGCLLAWRGGTLPPPRRSPRSPRTPCAARLPLRTLHLRAAKDLINAFQLSRLSDDASVATFQTSNATEYARWVQALCIEILGQTPLPQVRFLDVLPAADTAKKKQIEYLHKECPPIPPPRARRRLITPTETQLPLRDHSPAATDEGIVVEDDDYDSASDRSVDLTLSHDTTDAPIRKAEVIKCEKCCVLPQHHTLPRVAKTELEQGRKYMKRCENAVGSTDRSRYSTEARRKNLSCDRARSCSPNAYESSEFVPVRERRALFESLSRKTSVLGCSVEHLSRPPNILPVSPRRAASMHDLQAPPTRSVSDLRQFFESVARNVGPGCSGVLRHSAPPHAVTRPYVSLTCV